MRSLFLYFLILVSFTAAAQFPAASGGRSNQPGGIDTSPPILFLSSADPDPLVGGTFIIVTVSVGSKPVTGFDVTDFIKDNCTLSNFTSVDQFTYTVRVSPTIAGLFSVQIPAGVCQDLRGTPNLATDVFARNYVNSASSDLQNTTLTLSQHYRGHTASFTDCNDLLSSTSVAGMELLFSKYNFSSTMFANGDNTANRDMFNFGRCDFGTISVTAADFLVKQPLITAVRGGVAPSVQSYKNGDLSYSTGQRPLVLYGRSSNYQNHGQTLTFAYTGLTDVTMNPKGVPYRYDYFGKTTNTSYFVGTQHAGDSTLVAYVSTTLSSNGWYSNFVHWHWQVYNYPDHYLDQLTANIGSADVFRGSVNQVVEYYFAKEAVTSVSGIGNTLTVNYTKDWPSSPYDLIHTPVWVKIVTTGSNYAGHDIVASNGLRIRKISANVFYVPVLLDFNNSSTSIVIETTTSPNYVNLTAPVINRTGNSVTVDQACNLTIFRVQKPTSLASSSTSFSIPATDNTTVNMTVATGLTIPVGTALRISNDGTHFFYASVISYTSGTGALSVSSSGNTGTGTFSSWTIERYYHLVTATVVERKLTPVTSYTILATLDNTNYTYYVAAINADGVSSVIP